MSDISKELANETQEEWERTPYWSQIEEMPDEMEQNVPGGTDDWG